MIAKFIRVGNWVSNSSKIILKQPHFKNLSRSISNSNLNKTILFSMSQSIVKSTNKQSLQKLQHIYKQYGYTRLYCQAFEKQVAFYNKNNQINNVIGLNCYNLQKIKAKFGPQSYVYTVGLYGNALDLQQIKQVDAAQKFFMQCYQIVKKYPEMGKSFINLFYIQLYIGNFYSSLQNYSQCLKWYQEFYNKIPNFDQSDILGRFQKFNLNFQLGVLSARNNNDKQSLKYLKKAYEYIIQKNIQQIGKNEQVKCLFQLGFLQYKIEDKQQGRKKIETAILLLDLDNKIQDLKILCSYIQQLLLIGQQQWAANLLEKSKNSMQKRNQNVTERLVYVEIVRKLIEIHHMLKNQSKIEQLLIQLIQISKINNVNKLETFSLQLELAAMRFKQKKASLAEQTLKQCLNSIKHATQLPKQYKFDEEYQKMLNCISLFFQNNKENQKKNLKALLLQIAIQFDNFFKNSIYSNKITKKLEQLIHENFSNNYQ